MNFIGIIEHGLVGQHRMAITNEFKTDIFA